MPITYVQTNECKRKDDMHVTDEKRLTAMIAEIGFRGACAKDRRAAISHMDAFDSQSDSAFCS